MRRVDIECFVRDLEDRGKARATVARRLCTIVGFYRYAEEEGVIERSPAVHIRRPRIDYESHVAQLDRNELGATLVRARVSSPRDHALVSLLALNGLRASEAIGVSNRTPCVTPSSPPPWTPACRCATCKRPPATPIVSTFIAGASR